MSKLRPISPKCSKQTGFVSEDLQTCTHVFLRRDMVRPPLTPPYDGPFEVVKRSRKYFTIQLGSNKKDTVSIDRLKPAFLDQDDEGYRTRSGRLVRKTTVSFE